MGRYVDLPGVKTWYDEHGEGEPVVLLHGGFCTNETWEPQRADLAEAFHLFLPERRAHGHTPDVEGPITYADMTDDTIDFLDSVVGEPAHLIGWSDGAIVALLVAIARPSLVRKVVVIGANVEPASAIPDMAGMLEHMSADDPDLETFRSMYAAASPDGPNHWKVVVDKLIAMWRIEPRITPNDLARITAPTLVMVGDDDMMSLEHTAELYRAIPNAELAVVPGTSHALLMEKPELVNRLMLEFLSREATPTLFPVRRAQAAGSA